MQSFTRSVWAVGLTMFALWLTACGRTRHPGTGGNDIDGGDAPYPCTPWQPAPGPWSSLPTSRPANVGGDLSTAQDSLRPSATGRYIYAVGVWLDAGAVRRQIVRSSDVAGTWCVVTTAAAIADVMPSPTVEGVLYALTVPTASGTRDLLRTVDGGATWSSAAGGLPETFQAAGAGGPRLVIGGNPDVLWFEGRTGLYLTRDGGDSWTPVALPTDVIMPSLIVDPLHSERLVLPEQSSFSADWGASWTRRPPPEGYEVGAATVDASSVLYRAEPHLTPAGDLDSMTIWRSKDWGDSWHTMTLGGAVAVNLPSTLGSNVPGALFFASRTGLMGSADGGDTWHQVSDVIQGRFTALTPKVLIANTTVTGNLGASTRLQSTSDGGVSWRDLGRVARPTSLVASAVSPHPLWADAGSLHSYDGIDWIGSGDHAVVSPLLFADGVDAAVAYRGDMRTEDGGASWQMLTSPTGRGVMVIGVCAPPRSCVFAVDSPPRDTMMARSDDRGRTWSTPTPWTNYDTRTPVLASPDDPNHLVQGRTDGVYRTNDGGLTWNHVPLGEAIIGVAFLSDTDLIALSDQALLYASRDGGVSWAIMPAQPTPAGRARRLVQSTTQPRTFFVITDDPTVLFFRSDDAGASWAAVPAFTDDAGEPPYNHAWLIDVVDVGHGFLANIGGFGLASFE